MRDRHPPSSSSAPQRLFVDPKQVHVHDLQSGSEPGEHVVTLRFGSGGRLCVWPATDDPGGLARALIALGRAVIEFPQLAGRLTGGDSR